MTTEIGIVPTSPSPTRKRKLVARGLLVAAMAGGLAFAMAMPASAGTTIISPEGGGTVTTFDLTGGDLKLTVEATADWSATFNTTLASRDTTGVLGSVGVVDDRGGILPWTATAASSVFTGSGLSTSSSITYLPGTVDTTGTSVVAAATATTPVTVATAAVTVVKPTSLSGNNTADWIPTLTVTMPAGSLAGHYQGTVTTSIS